MRMVTASPGLKAPRVCWVGVAGTSAEPQGVGWDSSHPRASIPIMGRNPVSESYTEARDCLLTAPRNARHATARILLQCGRIEEHPWRAGIQDRELAQYALLKSVFQITQAFGERQTASETGPRKMRLARMWRLARSVLHEGF